MILQAPKLKVGELVRLSRNGPVYTVIRVTPGAAYLKSGDWTTEEGVLGGLETGIEAVSARAFVFREADASAEADDAKDLCEREREEAG